MVFAPKDPNVVVDPFTTREVPRASSLHKPGDAKVITYSRRRNKAVSAKRLESDDAAGLAGALETLAVGTPTRVTEPEPETSTAETRWPREPRDGDYEGPFQDSDSDCGGPGSGLKNQQRQRMDKNRGARLQRAAANAKDDAAAVRAGLSRQADFFAQLDCVSLPSESEDNSHDSPLVVVRKSKTTTTKGNDVDRVTVQAADKKTQAHAPRPTTPNTKLALTTEWLRAIPESFSPGADGDQSVEIEEEFVVSDEEEADFVEVGDNDLVEVVDNEGVDRDVEGEVVDTASERNADRGLEGNALGVSDGAASSLAPVAAAAAAAALAALGARSAVASLGAALGATSLQDTAAADTHASEFVSDYAAENLSFAKFLGECGQTATEVLCMSDALASYAGAWKIGEGTYGEAFKFGNTVLKIVPIAGDALVNGEPQMGCAQIAGEAAVARRLTSLRPTHSASHSSRKNVTSGFIDTKNVFVCVGPYARDLLDEWVAYDETKTSENENPGKFPRDQLYAVFASSDGGVDLERATIQNHAEATSILLQVTIALAVAEEACRFEHRDLHWGNVLLKPCGVDETKHATLNGVQLVYPTRGVDVNVIDFTLSRLDLGGGGDGVVGKGNDDVDTSKSSQTSQNLAYCDLGADPELFNGPEGHCQSETYRLMANAVAGDWSAHVPKTNALWLRYLADCLSSDKKYPCTHVELAELKAFKKRAAGYASAQEALWDGLFVGVFKTNYGG